jgi:Winged helix DNA-binding domain
VVQTISREQALAFRVHAQQLDRDGGTLDDTAVLDLGVQDTGPDGARWALALRGLADVPDDDVALAWTLRGAPHLYRRADLAAVASATWPFSDADAAKRIFDAAKPLKAAGIGTLEALDTVATAMRDIVREPTVKGEMSRRLTERMPEPYLRYCRPCEATHVHEQPFRLAALHAGLELEPGTSPPVLRPVPGLAPAVDVPERLDVVRGCLRLLGPTSPKHVAGYLDAPVREVQGRWPADAVEVAVDGEKRWVLEDDVDAFDRPAPDGLRLLASFDLFLQARDRDLLVPDTAAAKDLWRILGRPGAVLAGAEIVGTWRARKSGASTSVTVQLRTSLPRALVAEQAERLAAFRNTRLTNLDIHS